MAERRTIKPDKRRLMRQNIRWGAALVAFLVVNFVLRLALIPINQAEYTDGLLQILQFDIQTGIWPPLYTLLCWPFNFLIGFFTEYDQPSVWVGRVISSVFSAAAVVPIFLMARRSFGLRAAVGAAILYTVAPVSLRWAPRVMTDAVFSFFFYWTCERLLAAQGARDLKEANNALLWTCAVGALATLTRYQGLLFIPAILGVAAWHKYRNGFIPWKGVSGVVLFSLVFIWSSFYGTIHDDQFMERAGRNPLKVLALNGEAFLLITPYFLTYPVAFFVFLGLFRGRGRPHYAMMPLTLYVAAVLLVVQSLFSSFQGRYFLPLYGLLWVWGGVGLAVSDALLRRKHLERLRPWVIILTVVCSLGFSIFVLVGQRTAFGDIKKASEFAGTYVEEHGGRLYTNEIYREGVHAIKVSYWARQEASFLGQEYLFGRNQLRPGDILVLSSAYNADLYLAQFMKNYDMEPLKAVKVRLLPLLPDIMEQPGTAQNPTAWMFRYNWQEFETSVWRIDGVAPVVEQNWSPPAF